MEMLETWPRVFPMAGEIGWRILPRDPGIPTPAPQVLMDPLVPIVPLILLLLLVLALAGIALLLMPTLLRVGKVLRLPGLLAGTVLAIAALTGTEWIWLLWRHPLEPLPLLLHLGSLAGLALALIAAARAGALALLGLDLLGLSAALGAFLLLDPIAVQLPGVAWLMLALLALEAANRPGGPMARHCLILGLAYLLLFGGAHLLVIHQSPAHLALGPLRVRGRLLIELFAIAVADTWAWVPAGRGLRDLPLWRRIQPCFLEVSLVGVVVMILTEIAELWRPLAWTLLALALITPALRGRLPLRTQLYSVFFYWLAVATVVGTLAQLESPSALWHQRPQAIGLLVVGLQGGYVAASHRWLDLAALCQLGDCPCWDGLATGSPTAATPGSTTRCSRRWPCSSASATTAPCSPCSAAAWPSRSTCSVPFCGRGRSALSPWWAWASACCGCWPSTWPRPIWGCAAWCSSAWAC